jgi:hypothetical protein
VTVAEALLARHERLCFQRAFPKNTRELRRAERELADFERLAARHRDQLRDTGIAGTTYHYPFNHAMARWLRERYGRAVEIDWPAYRRRPGGDDVADLLALFVAPAENEGIDDEDLPSWDWIRAAKGTRDRRTDLAWVLDVLAAQRLPPQVESHLFEALNVQILWDLAGCRDAVTHARLPARPFFHRTLLTGRPDDFRREVLRAPGALQPLSPARADRVIHAARAALSQREREFHVIVHGHRREVYRVDAGRGLDIYVIGLHPAERLTLESDYGALLVKNGVPIGYGYGVVLLDRVDVGINVFPTYRGGESAYVLHRFCAVFHHHFGARKFVVRRYQVGWQNPEGIEAGSFWFYYKLGFRPLSAAVRRRAEEERARLERRGAGARSRPEVLKALARSDVFLATDGTSPEAFRDLDLKRVGLAVTRLIRTHCGGDRPRALREAVRRVAVALRQPARAVPERLAPVAALVRDLARWEPAERRALAGLLRAKEGPRERAFVLAMLRHTRWRRWLLETFPGPRG